MRATIVALSSGAGRAAVAVLRVSGPMARSALETLAGSLPPPRRARLAGLTDPESGEALDRALLLWFPGPKSFTGEDLAEFHLHGGRAVVAGVLAALTKIAGIRLAEPGEFTRRAFDAGKLDLAEVEGLADLINAETAAQRRQALAQLDGGLSVRVADWSERLTGALARFEAVIDFADEEIGEGNEAIARESAKKVADEIAAALADNGRGERLRDGLQVAIVGPPNAGKSSFLNMLAGRDAAIVAATPGTTRDVVEVRLELEGLPVTLADTAGLRVLEEGSGGEGGGDGAVLVELEGMRRSRQRAESADLVCAIFDLGAWPGLEPAVAALLRPGDLLLLNKWDGASAEWTVDTLAERSHELAPPLAEILDRGSALPMSVSTGRGLEAVLERLTAEVRALLGEGDTALVTRERQRVALEEAVAGLRGAASEPAIELVAEAVRLALRALGRVSGRVDVEDVLDLLFGEFCIGK